MKHLAPCIAISLVGFVASSATVADIVHNDDVIINNSSLCVGFDCVNGESFGSDTVRLKENNLRIHFADTSNSLSFASNDWRIVVNGENNGDPNYFSIEDATAGRRVFTVEAGARANALVVEASGEIGIGTENPVAELHAVTGDTPTLRLEQDTSSGFAAQTWDVAGNETSFFVRDASNGSTLPLRIFPGSASGRLAIRGQNVGVGTISPLTALHVDTPDKVGGGVFVNNSSDTESPATLFKLSNKGNTKFEIREEASGTTWIFANPGNEFRISKFGTGQVEFAVQNNGDATLAGALTQNSDINGKQNIVPVDPDKLLESLSRIPISQWQYKDAPGVNHIGPMAQDFYAAFKLGHTDTGISTLDTSGIALAAIQALKQRNDRLAEENHVLADRIRTLENRQVEIQAMMSELRENSAPKTIPVVLSPN